MSYSNEKLHADNEWDDKLQTIYIYIKPSGDLVVDENVFLEVIKNKFTF